MVFFLYNLYIFVFGYTFVVHLWIVLTETVLLVQEQIVDIA